MEETFEREGFSKYIVFRIHRQSNDLKMLAENEIDGVLAHELKNINGENSLYYHIEGCQAISAVFEQKQWNYTELKNLFQAICQCLYMLREYLLPMDALLLDGEHIYWSWQQETVKFLVVPDYELSISRQLTAFVEYLMHHLNYEDRRASDWLYGFYDALRKQGASYELLCTYCRQESDRKISDAEKGNVSNHYDAETEQALQEMYYMDENKWVKRISECVEWIKRIWGDWNMGKGMKNNKNKEKDTVYTEVLPENGQQEIFVQICEAADSDRKQILDSETTVLSEECTVPRLKPIEPGYPYIIPQTQTMLIGRQEASCNYVLSCQDISRVHASVLLKDNLMLVTDLNSSNGTYVNQKRLEIQESITVRRGDEVCFGSVRYVAI